MKIIDSEPAGLKEFKDLEPGDVFARARTPDIVMMKVHHTNCSAVALEDGCGYAIEDYEDVYPLEAVLSVKR